MPFNDPEENQDETAVAELEPGYPAGGARLATNMSAGILPVGSPTRILLPGARTALWPTQSRGLPSQPALGIGHRIVAMGQEQAEPLGGAFSLGKVGMRPPQQPATSRIGPRPGSQEQSLGIGHRILGISGQPKSVPTLKSWSPPRPEPLIYPNSARAGFNGTPQSQGIFSSFVPSGTNREGTESVKRNQTGLASAQQLFSRSIPGTNSVTSHAAQKVRASLQIPHFSSASNAQPDVTRVGAQPQKTLNSPTQRMVQQSSQVEVQNPLGTNVNPEIPGHVLPDIAGPELRELLNSSRWSRISASDKAKLASLMSQDMAAANAYAQVLLSGKPRPTGGSESGRLNYFGPEVDDLMHSSAWIDGRLKPDEKAALAQLVRNNDVAGATALAKKLQRGFWYEGRYPQFAKSLAGRINRAAEIAGSYRYNKRWLVEAEKGQFGRNSDKCNLFVSDVLREAGLDSPARHNGWGGPINAAEWANRSLSRIGHWQIVDGPPEPGDVIAEITGHDPRNPKVVYAHVGVVVGDGRTASASTRVYPPGMVVMNDWGFRNEDLGKRVIRRYVP